MLLMSAFWDDSDSMVSSITVSKKAMSSFEAPRDNSFLRAEHVSCPCRDLSGSDRMRALKRRDDCIESRIALSSA